MATTFKLEGEVDINASAAQAAVQALASNFSKLSQNSRTSAATLAKLAPILQAATKAADTERRSIEAANKVQEQSNKLRRESQANVKLTNARTQGVQQNTTDKSAIADAQRLLVTNRAITEQVRQRMLVADANSKIQARSDQTAIANSRLLLAQQRQQAAAQRDLRRAQDDSTLGLTAMRYALFSVSATAGVAGAALMKVATEGLGVGIEWQKAFAEVQRTSGALDIKDPEKAERAISGLRSQFSELVTTLPVTYTELTKIGTLAGQLGVPMDNIGSFTKIVAQFSATTDVSSEAAATAFGRLSAIIPDVNGDYQGLADSILKVGVHSVATESAIINVTTQISSVAAQAGFGYKQIIGLSGALASIGVPPELSRGTMTRVFGDISRAISNGGIELEKFGKVAGMSGEDFAASWSNDAAGTFQKFMEGIRLAGGDAESVIRSLGITSVRDVPILMRLAGAADAAGKKGGLLAQTMGDAADAAGTLQKQYQVISGTVGAKLQVMLQSVQNAINDISSTQLGAFGDIIDGITTNIQHFTDALGDNVRVLDMFDLPFTNAEALGVTLTITGIVGALALLIAGLGAIASGGIALTQVWKSVTGHFAAQAAATATSTTSLGANTAALAANTGAAQANGTAARGVGGAATTAALGYRGFANTIGSATPGMTKFNAALANGGDILRGYGGPAIGRAGDAIGKLGSKLGALATAFGPQLIAMAGIAFSAAVLQWESDARNMGTSTDEMAKSFTRAKTSADLLGSIKTNRGGWLSAAFGDTSQVKPFLSDLDKLGEGLDNIRGNGFWADMQHHKMDIWNPGSETSFANMTSGLDKLDAGFKQLVDAGNADKAARQMQGLIDSSKLTDSELSTLIERMPEYKHALTTALDNKGIDVTNKSLRNMAREGLVEVKDGMAELAGVSEEALANTFDGVDEDAMGFLQALSDITSGMVDFSGAYQDTLDRVNAKGKEAWVKEGHNVADYVDVAKASLPDYFATIDQQIANQRARLSNIAAVVMNLGPEYAAAAGKLGDDILGGIVDAMNKGDMDPLNTFKRQVDEGTGAAIDLANQNIANMTPAMVAEFAALGGGSAQAFYDAITKGDKSINQIMQELRDAAKDPIKFVLNADPGPARSTFDDTHAYAEAMEIWLHARGDTMPARNDFLEEKDYLAALTYWMNTRGNTRPAIDDFNDAQGYAEAMKIWLEARGNTAPAEKDFKDAKSYGDALKAWMTAFANTGDAEAALNWAARNRSLTINATMRASGIGDIDHNPSTPYATGGWTGPGAKYKPAGVVHADEFVFTKEATNALGTDYLYGLMNSATRGYSSGGAVAKTSASYATSFATQQTIRLAAPGISIVELSPADRELLRAAGNLQVIIPQSAIAGSANSFNARQAKRGSN
jgi:TP901 family phage tail tape measure protein